MKTLSLVLIVFLWDQSVFAQFTGLEDFVAASKNPSKWGPEINNGNGHFLQSGDGVLRFYTAGSSTQTPDLAAWPWIVGDGPFSNSWSVQIDVNVPNISLPLSGGWLTAGLEVTTLEGALTARLEQIRDEPGDPQTRNFASHGEGIGPTIKGSVPAPSAFGAVRIDWNASTRILSVAYDTNGAAGGYTWTVFNSLNPTLTNTFNMAGTETFKIAVRIFSEGLSVPTDANVFADNFYVLDDSRPILGINRVGDSSVLGWTRLALGYGLESSATVNGAWSAVTNTPAVSGDHNTVSVSTSNLMNFFRLRK